MSQPQRSPLHLAIPGNQMQGGYSPTSPSSFHLGPPGNAGGPRNSFDGAMLSPAAAPFQPGGIQPQRSASSGARQGGFVPPHVLQQIQSHISPGGMSHNGGQRAPAPRLGTLNPSASAFSFAPAGGPPSPGGFRAPPVFTPGAMMSPNSAAFTPGGVMQAQQQQQPGTPGTPGIATPTSSVAGGGFFAGRGGAPAARGGRRGARGPPTNQPIKISGHNSTPSVSLAPAAFAAALAAAGATPGGKPKRKIIVTLPKEGGQDVDEAAAAAAAKQAAQAEGAEEAVVATKAAAAATAASIRAKWLPRAPAEAAPDSAQVEAKTRLPQASIISREIHPEPEAGGLPSSIDIYLPGKTAWNEYREQRLEERLNELGTSVEPMPPWQQQAQQPHDSGWGLGAGGGDGGAFGLAGHHGQSLSISSPADPSMVSNRLNSYLLSQAAEATDPSMASPSGTNADLSTEGDSGLPPPPTRFTDVVPQRLREAAAAQFAKRSSSPALHGQTMSLSMPSSGGPFGPSALDALGLAGKGSQHERSLSDTENTVEPALGERPRMERGMSEAGADLKLSAAAAPFTLPGKKADAPDAAAAAAAAPGGAGWQDLGRGFGYDIEEVDEENLTAEERSVSHSRHASSKIPAEELEAALWDQRTNPSEDGDMSGEEEDLRDEDEDLEDLEEEEDEFSDLSDSRSPSEEEYSNPSDEEAAHDARQQRRALRAEIRAGEAIARRRAREKERTHRGRTQTNDTLASSSIGEGDYAGPWAFDAPRSVARAHDGNDIISNPSDEEDLGTFGGHGPIDHVEESGHEPRISQDFSFPPRSGLHSQTGSDAGPFSFRPPATPQPMNTLGRAAMRSALNPGAKEFTFGGTVSQASRPEGRFRLPSIHNSSFGSSAFNAGAADERLNAAAPSFTPASFTFTAPGGAPKLQMPPVVVTDESDLVTPTGPGAQGREKRQRFRGSGGTGDGFNDPLLSPPRPAPSAASIEGPMRDTSRRGPPPFNASGLSTIMQSPVVPEHASAASGIYGGVNRAGGRPGIPSFVPAPGVTASGIPETAEFTFHVESKAVPIRRPEDQENQEPQQQQQHQGDDRGGKRRAPAAPIDNWQIDPRLTQLEQQGRSSAVAIPVPDGARARSHQRRDSASSLVHIRGGRSLAREDSDLDGSDAGSDDEGTVSDIIEELGERMDKALEGWAGKILDEVTIMGQVRPAAAPFDRQAIVDAVSLQIQRTFESTTQQVERVSQQMERALEEWQTKAAAAAPNPDDSSVTVRPSSGRSLGHGPLDAQGELDFDFVQEVLDAKISNLQRDLTAAFDTALPRVGSEVKAAAPAPAPALPDASALATIVVNRIQPLLEKHLAGVQQPRESISDVIEPLLEEHFARATAKATADRQDVAHVVTEALGTRVADWEKSLAEAREGMGEMLQVTLVNGIVPHLETLRHEPVDPDVVAARVTEILAPMIAEGRMRAERAEPRSRSGTVNSMTAPDATAFADAALERLAPLLESLQSLDADSVVQRITQALDKQASEHMDPVVALLEPIVSHQGEVRDLSRKIMERQRETESTLSDLPSAINAKTDVYLSATQATQATLLERLDEVVETVKSSTARSEALDKQRDELLAELDAARKDASEQKAFADEARAELSAANSYSNTLKDELTRLEARLDQAEKDSDEVATQAATLRRHEETTRENALERAHAAERAADEAIAKAREVESTHEALAKQNELYTAHIAELRAELHASREERGRERESAAQATAEALARADKAEQAAQVARDEARAAVERAAKAEGELSSLDKRVHEQDNKIANLQQLTATQKQKAAQSQQQLAQGEKRLAAYEAEAHDYAVAQARLSEMESRVADRESLQQRLSASQDVELKLREELSNYHSKFIELEGDLISMREGLVGRDELDAVKADLATKQAEVAAARAEADLLREQASASRLYRAGGAPIKSFTTWDNSPSNSSTWASVHAPADQDDYREGHGTVSPHRSFSGASRAATVEQSADGWWS